MITKTKRRALTGASAAALLLLGGVYAWNNTSQHKTNEFSNSFKDNDVTLVEDFVPITDWAQGQTVNKDISVKNNTNAATGSSAYVRISLKEFLEFTNKTENFSKVRYAVTTAGDFAKFDNQADAQTYATANGLDAPVQVPTTAYEGSNKWFIPTKAGATHGQYGKFLVLSVGGGTPKSIIDANVTKASNVNHQALTHAEDAYTTQLFKNGGKDINLARYYDPAKLVTDYPTGAGIEKGKDLKDYITWSFGPNVTTLADFDPAKATSAQWVIDTATGWAYWSEALAPSQSTTHFLDSVTLSKSPENAALYYAIHTDLEAVDFSEIDTMSAPPKIEDAWGNQKFAVTFDSNGGSAVSGLRAKQGELIGKPADPTKAGYDFVGWYAKSDLSGNKWDFSKDKMSAQHLTLYAKWKATVRAKVYFKDYTGTKDVMPAQDITVDNPDLVFSAPPSESDTYFIGWAEVPNADKTQMVYIRDTQDYVQHRLNAPDQKYLGYAVKPEHEIKNVQTDKTFYAVSFKSLKGTGQADATNPQAQEFIWNNAIWRVLKADGNNRLVIKVSGLTETEVTGLGFKLETGNTIQPLSNERTLEDAGIVHFHSQNGNPDTDNEKYFFNSDTDDGYSRSRVKAIIDAYYNNLSDRVRVLPVDLNLPNFTTYKQGVKFTDGGTSFSKWGRTADWFTEKRFETIVGTGKKQAFALSYGDINVTIGQVNGDISELLNFQGSNRTHFWFRSPGHYELAGGVIADGRLRAHAPVHDALTVRPALYLSVN